MKKLSTTGIKNAMLKEAAVCQNPKPKEVSAKATPHRASKSVSNPSSPSKKPWRDMVPYTVSDGDVAKTASGNNVRGKATVTAPKTQKKGASVASRNTDTTVKQGKRTGKTQTVLKSAYAKGEKGGKEYKLKTRPTRSIKQVTAPSKSKIDHPSVAAGPKKIDNVYESVTLIVDGKKKKPFGIISESAVDKLMEEFTSIGYDVQLVKSAPAAWKSDKMFKKLVFEAIDAKYNNMDVASAKLTSKALDRLFFLVSGDNNHLYESQNDFLNTVRATLTKVLEASENVYRDHLNMYSAIARVVTKRGVEDVELVVEATGTPMALRNVRDELYESFGLNTKIRHIFIDGEKFTKSDIKDWKSNF